MEGVVCPDESPRSHPRVQSRKSGDDVPTHTPLLRWVDGPSHTSLVPPSPVPVRSRTVTVSATDGPGPPCSGRLSRTGRPTTGPDARTRTRVHTKDQKRWVPDPRTSTTAAVGPEPTPGRHPRPRSRVQLPSRDLLLSVGDDPVFVVPGMTPCPRTGSEGPGRSLSRSDPTSLSNDPGEGNRGSRFRVYPRDSDPSPALKPPEGRVGCVLP